MGQAAISAENALEDAAGVPESVLSGSEAKICDRLPPPASFRPVATGASPNGWCANSDCPDWLFKREEQVYFHAPTSSLWRRRGKVLVQIDSYSSALGGFASSSPKVLLRAVFSAWRKAAADKKRWCMDSAEIVPEESTAPDLRSAPKGLRRSRRGVSPPPTNGWRAVGHGWEAHADAQQWLRKSEEASCMDSAVFFYKPTESLWMQLPSGIFACVETYHTALAIMISSSELGLSRLVFCKWRNQVHVRTVVNEWRQRIQVMSGSFNDDQQDAAQELDMPCADQTAVWKGVSGQRRSAYTLIDLGTP
mmetsp:Transcript_110940/g.192371  ORF Transcript_110940/g.192371 Transcript_110940/m.192371 type:complete len:307 (+) Transcript_110940:63-983(+)